MTVSNTNAVHAAWTLQDETSIVEATKLLQVTNHLLVTLKRPLNLVSDDLILESLELLANTRNRYQRDLIENVLLVYERLMQVNLDILRVNVLQVDSFHFAHGLGAIAVHLLKAEAADDNDLVTTRTVRLDCWIEVWNI